jgi:hypothetical protein
MPAQTRPTCVSCGRWPCLARAERSAARAVAGARNLELACADQRGRRRLQRIRRAAMARRSGFFCSCATGRFQSCRWRWSCSRLWCSMLLMMKRALCTWVLLPLVETDPTSASFRCLRICSHSLSGGNGTPRRLSYMPTTHPRLTRAQWLRRRSASPFVGSTPLRRMCGAAGNQPLFAHRRRTPRPSG